MKTVSYDFQLVVVGGGISGVCAALAAARHGAKTALIQDRPVLGGNASSEFRMHICGADRHAGHPGLRETGILEEILLEVKKRNYNPHFWELDVVLWEKCITQENLTLFLNTHVTDVQMEMGNILAVYAIQMTSERRITLRAPLFMDATGDATVAHLAGAITRTGREGREEFGEHWAPEKPDTCTMGSSLMFTAVDCKRPVPFTKPKWAYTFTEEDLAGRDHSEITSGYWWIERGGDDLDVIDNAETIRDELMKSLMGIWDHIKNGGDHGAENYALDWVAFLPGKRESRRVEGDYLLREQDLLAERVFPDAVAYGGWSMDCHIPGGLCNSKADPTRYLGDFGAYTIPYRCLYSKNINNLFVVGRPISVTHMAFSSTRVMATCAVVGQAGGTAAALALHKGLTPRGVGDRIKVLQNALMRDDCWLPGYCDNNPDDAAQCAQILSSSFLPGCEPENVINGVHRAIGKQGNAWITPMDPHAWLELRFKKPEYIAEIVLRFDSDLTREITPTISERIRKRQYPGIPPTLVQNYILELYLDGRRVAHITVKDNAQRLNRHQLKNKLMVDSIRLTIISTNGDSMARLFAIHAYRSQPGAWTDSKGSDEC